MNRLPNTEPDPDSDPDLDLVLEPEPTPAEREALRLALAAVARRGAGAARGPSAWASAGLRESVARLPHAELPPSNRGATRA